VSGGVDDTAKADIACRTIGRVFQAGSEAISNAPRLVTEVGPAAHDPLVARVELDRVVRVVGVGRVIVRTEPVCTPLPNVATDIE